jgi:DNA (cytosine-5)-methyltransferase 3A
MTKRPLNILSLFDGMSCARIALDRLGLQVNNYYACEIDKYAIQVSTANYPDIQQIGDITAIKADDYPNIDLLIGGSPCQGFSFAGKQLAFDDPRSKLFFEFVRVLREVKPKYFLLENVRMKQEYQDVISEHLGVKPIKINSAIFSAQSRNRFYWTNIPLNEIPEDRGIVLADILEEVPFGEMPNYLANHWGGEPRADKVKGVTDPKANCLTASMYKGQIPTFVKRLKPNHVGTAVDIKGHDSIKRVYSPNGKSPTLTTMGGGHREPKVSMGRVVNRRLDENGVRKDNQMELPFTPKVEVRQDDKSNCLTTVQKDNVVVYDKEQYTYRKLTPLECERLQTVPDNYTNYVSNTQRYKMLGNGFTVEVIAFLLTNLKGEDL